MQVSAVQIAKAEFMSCTPRRADLLRDYDAARRSFVEDCADRAEAGARIAGQDVRVIEELAAEVAGSLILWKAVFDQLDLARDAGGRRPAVMDVARAGDLVVETLFDELLAPAATRLLAASLALAEAQA
jgi:hypothetical protein